MNTQFKLRASAGGKLATNPTAADAKKGALLSKTSISYLKEWLTGEIYGYQKEIKSKYIEKGNLLEDAAIDYAIQVLDLPFVLKNETHYMDEYFIGTPDIVTDDEVIDIKCSWDCLTFPLFENDIPTDDYFYQLQIYMHLTGKRKSRLVYVLMDTPEHMHWERSLTYGHLDAKYRIKSFDVTYDDEVIAMLQTRVMAAREYIQEHLLTLIQ